MHRLAAKTLSVAGAALAITAFSVAAGTAATEAAAVGAAGTGGVSADAAGTGAAGTGGVSAGTGGAVVRAASAGTGGIGAGMAYAANTTSPASHAASERAGTAAGSGASRHVVLVGIGGLRWSDVSPAATPALWAVARQGSGGSLIVSGVKPRTCPVDGWLTLNAAARVAVAHPGVGPCPATPRVVAVPAQSAGAPGRISPARIPALRRLIAYNAQFHYNPQWGLLATAAGRDKCVTAVGPGAALALVHPDGWDSRYLASASRLTPATLARCPLTVVDLGNLPSAGGPAGHMARTAVLAAADHELAVIKAGLPADATLVVAAPGDGSSPHLRVVVIDGPGYRAGLLASVSTRQPGVVLLTDLTPTILHWFGAPVPSAVVGSPLRSAARERLPAVLAMLRQQDLAAQVYWDTHAPFFQLVGFGYPVLFAVIWLLPWGSGPDRPRRRRMIARTIGVWAASVPAGTFLASLVPWWSFAHPAAVLYALTAGFASLVAAICLAGPWRHDPIGPPGAVAAFTAGVIGLDLMTGSRLQLETPFGLSLLEAGRFYGLGNNAVAIYSASGILCAAWLGGSALRKGFRSLAVAVIAAVAAFTVIAAGWPGFGAKVGGTVAMVPGFLLLLAAAAGLKLTARRVLLALASGVALVAAFALINYFVPLTGHSDIAAFVGQSLHGGAGGVLQRKVNSNLGSLTANPFVLVIPVVVAVLGVTVAWPARLRASLLVRAYQRIPLLKAALSAIWLAAVLGWFAEDSGVTVPAAGLPLVLPLAVVIFSSLPAGIGDPAGQPMPAGTSDDDGPADAVVPGGGRMVSGSAAPAIVDERLTAENQATGGGAE